jgi:hypothetical protein
MSTAIRSAATAVRFPERVLHLPVVLLEAVDRLPELGVGLREPLLHPRERLGRPDPGHDVLALRVDEKLAPDPRLAGGRIAGEADAGPRVVAFVPEHHLNDVHGCPEVLGNPVGAAVDLGARRLPGVEDGPDGAVELLLRVLREVTPRRIVVDLLEALDELLQVVRPELHVLGDAAPLLQRPERLLKAMRVDAVDDLAVHLEEPPVRVVGEAGISGGRGEPLDRLVVQAQVEDRVHHPRHRHGGARADGHEERVVRVGEPLPGRLLESAQVLLDLLLEPGRKPLARAHVRDARLGRDREAGGDRDRECRHLGEARTLAAEQLPAELRALTEVVYVLAHRASNLPIRLDSHAIAGLFRYAMRKLSAAARKSSS